jgi:hypothetical protein
VTLCEGDSAPWICVRGTVIPLDACEGPLDACEGDSDSLDMCEIVQGGQAKRVKILDTLAAIDERWEGEIGG